LVQEAPRLARVKLHALIDFIFGPLSIKKALLIFWGHGLNILVSGLALDKYGLN
jgi:hypothetical protein